MPAAETAAGPELESRLLKATESSDARGFLAMECRS
jgi:hypothetical protein